MALPLGQVSRQGRLSHFTLPLHIPRVFQRASILYSSIGVALNLGSIVYCVLGAHYPQLPHFYFQLAIHSLVAVLASHWPGLYPHPFNLPVSDLTSTALEVAFGLDKFKIS